MVISHIQPTCMPSSDDHPGYSQIVKDDFYAYFAGIVAADFPEGQEILGDVRGETRVLLNKIREMLAEIAIDMDRIVRVDVHLANFDEFEKMDAVYREFFKEGRYPARTTTESPSLYGRVEWRLLVWQGYYKSLNLYFGILRPPRPPFRNIRRDFC